MAIVVDMDIEAAAGLAEEVALACRATSYA
jgi:hypothetical protein